MQTRLLVLSFVWLALAGSPARGETKPPAVFFTTGIIPTRCDARPATKKCLAIQAGERREWEVGTMKPWPHIDKVPLQQVNCGYDHKCESGWYVVVGVPKPEAKDLALEIGGVPIKFRRDQRFVAETGTLILEVLVTNAQLKAGKHKVVLSHKGKVVREAELELLDKAPPKAP